jgi:hypothetical protein
MVLSLLENQFVGMQTGAEISLQTEAADYSISIKIFV